MRRHASRIGFAVICLSLLAALAVPALAASPPVVVKTFVSGVTTNEATLNSELEFGPGLTGCAFEYGLDEGYGSEIPCEPDAQIQARLTIAAVEGQF
ncbi:MAG TPA: hypothetical protein VLC07_08690, partial [Solirubrobacterales bacterium]|nr:hypothetical protein [Solirubrobacterales bacterium]